MTDSFHNAPKKARATALLRWAIAGALLLGLGLAVQAQPRWEKLGDRYVNHSVDRDEIKVTAKDGRFDAIKLRVTRRPVRFRDVKVHFGNGEVQDVEVRKRIPAGGETRVIALKGDQKRVIEKVVFWYDTAGKVRKKRRPVAKAEVELWGRH